MGRAFDERLAVSCALLAVLLTACSLDRTPTGVGRQLATGGCGAGQLCPVDAGTVAQPRIEAQDDRDAEAGNEIDRSPAAPTRPVAAAACPKDSKDPDCLPAVTCGNGVIEDNEECDGDALCAQTCRRMFDVSLVHRYSFGDRGRDVRDSVGSADGSMVGAELDGSGDLTLQGGSGRSSPYVRLPAGLLSGLTSATIEVWITWQGGEVWERVFDFGNAEVADEDEFQGTSFWYLTPRSELDGLRTEMNFTPAPWDSETDATVERGGALSVGKRHHVVATFDDATKTLALYVDGKPQGTTERVAGALSEIDDANVLIGRSQFESDPALSAVVHEFRIYDRALRTDAIAQSFDRGPDPMASIAP